MKSLSNCLRTLACALLATGLTATTQGAANYILVDLGVGAAYGVNNSNQVVGASGADAMIWNVASDNSITSASLTNLYNGSGGVASGINDTGMVVGYSGREVFEGYWNIRAFVWTPQSANGITGTISEVTPEFNDEYYVDWQTWATSINNSNQIFGVVHTNALFRHGFICGSSSVSNKTWLVGFTPATWDERYPGAINNSGNAVGSASGDDTNSPNEGGPGGYDVFYRAAYWTNGTTAPVNLGALNGSTTTWTEESHVFAMNNNNKMAGCSTTNGSVKACIWTSPSAQSIVSIGALGSTDHSYANGINDSDEVVGRNVAGSTVRAFVYDSTNGMRNLNNLITNTDWTLIEGTAINNSGCIVGYGTKNGQTRAFFLRP